MPSSAAPILHPWEFSGPPIRALDEQFSTKSPPERCSDTSVGTRLGRNGGGIDGGVGGAGDGGSNLTRATPARVAARFGAFRSLAQISRFGNTPYEVRYPFTYNPLSNYHPSDLQYRVL
jgi:hypothetical protein